MASTTSELEAPFGRYRPPQFVEWLSGAPARTRNPILLYLARKAIIRYHKNVHRHHDLEIDGLRFRVEPHRNIQDRIMFRDRRLPDAAVIGALFEGFATDAVFFDIGANVGLYSIMAARALGPSARIIAIEPHPRTSLKLRTNLSFNDAGGVTVIETALGDQEGELELFESCGHNEGANTAVRRSEDATGVTVPVTTVPTLMDRLGINRIDILKIDVEGFEDRVLGPMLDGVTPERWPIRIALEHKIANDWRFDIVAALKDAGYAEIWRDEENLLLERAR